MGLFNFLNKSKQKEDNGLKESCFEDEFSDIQSGLISLCLEFTNSNVDMVFGYCSIEENSLMFNAFFKRDGKILSARDAAYDSDVREFLKVGTSDLDKFRVVCAKWNQPCPKQIKMVYDVRTRKFNADISYESRIPYELKGNSIFMEWMEDEQGKCQ